MPPFVVMICQQFGGGLCQRQSQMRARRCRTTKAHARGKFINLMVAHIGGFSINFGVKLGDNAHKNMHSQVIARAAPKTAAAHQRRRAYCTASNNNFACGKSKIGFAAIFAAAHKNAPAVFFRAVMRALRY